MSTFSNVSSETTRPIEVKFHVVTLWDGETKEVCSNGPGHLTKMAAMPKYGKNPLKILPGTKKGIALETWYAASGTQILPSLFKWWPLADLRLFYGKVKFASIAFYMGKSFNCRFLRNHWSLSKKRDVYSQLNK